MLERLGEISNPILVLGGRFDEATPTITEATHRAIRGSEWLIFEQSAHLPHLEETEHYLQVLETFLQRHDPNGSAVVGNDRQVGGAPQCA